MTTGPSLFARFAFPPNALGYCGPSDSIELFEASTAGADREIGSLARRFEGAWPYLELIAGANGIPDPLDHLVVEAYWVGNHLLGEGARYMAGSLDERFRMRSGRHWEAIASAAPAGAVPHHSHHVFGVYPWVGLLRSGRVEEPLEVLDRCRIRWGTVVAVDDDMALISSRPLTWDGTRLAMGDPRDEWAAWASGGTSPIAMPEAGDVVAAHWGWVCDRLDPRRLRNLQAWTAHTLRLVNGKTPIGAVVG
ncbi:MAG TPA: DUF6390 family protein [Acidimicrobiia bacterium]|nr:DUF6390 family protein [Acidimicrobiia bacterium]